MPITDWNAPRDRSSVRDRKFPAALLTRMSSGPSAQMPPIISSTAAASRTSQRLGVDRAAGALVQLLLGRRQNFFAASADVDFRTQFKKPPGRGFAESRAAARDQDAFVAQQIVLEHSDRP